MIPPVGWIHLRSDVCTSCEVNGVYTFLRCSFTWRPHSSLYVHTWSFSFLLPAFPLPPSLSFSNTFILRLYPCTQAKDLLVGVRTATPPTGITAPPPPVYTQVVLQVVTAFDSVSGGGNQIIFLTIPHPINIYLYNYMIYKYTCLHLCYVICDIYGRVKNQNSDASYINMRRIVSVWGLSGYSI